MCSGTVLKHGCYRFSLFISSIFVMPATHNSLGLEGHRPIISRTVRNVVMLKAWQ